MRDTEPVGFYERLEMNTWKSETDRGSTEITGIWSLSAWANSGPVEMNEVNDQ